MSTDTVLYPIIYIYIYVYLNDKFIIISISINNYKLIISIS